MSESSFVNEAGELARATLDSDGNVPIVGSVFSWYNSAVLESKVIKNGSGFLHTVTVNTPVATGVVKLYDNVGGTGTPICSITTPAVFLTYTLHYDVNFNNGLYLVTSVAAQDVTVSYK